MFSTLGIWILIASCTAVLAVRQMDTIYEWKYIDYSWTSDDHRYQAIKSGQYNYTRILPMDVDKSSRDGRVFLTFRGERGVTATVGVVSKRVGPSGPLIEPYPDWATYSKFNCDSILNVYRVAIDSCNRIWMVDNGYLEGENATCPPTLHAFNLTNDQRIFKVPIPNDIASKDGGEYLFTNVVLETDGFECQRTTVYMAESIGASIITWNGNEFTRVESPLFRPVPGAEEITSGGNTVRLNGGVVGMSLTRRFDSFTEPRKLFFRPLVSFDLYEADTNEIRQQPNQVRYNGAPRVLTSQALGQAFNFQNTLFLGMTKESGIACWNRYTPLSADNFELIAQDSQKLQYPNGVKVIPASRFNLDEELLVLSNRFTAFELTRLNLDEINFRVLSSPVQSLIAGTKCSISQQNQVEVYQPIAEMWEF